MILVVFLGLFVKPFFWFTVGVMLLWIWIGFLVDVLAPTEDGYVQESADQDDE